jgi:solute:Na+ symporter, SSS family
MRKLDVAIIGFYLLTLLAIGFRFARGQKTTEKYFVAGRSVPWWAMGLSLLATIITSVTFIAYPGAAYAGDWSLLVPNLMFVGVLVLVGAVIVPFFRHSIAMSAYEYFGKRFGTGVRLYSSFAFAMGHFSKMGFVVYLLALTLSGMTGWNTGRVIVVAGAVTILYTMLGGMEAVIWADVLQGFILWAGILVSLGTLLFLPPGGPGAVLHEAWIHNKISLGSPSFHLGQPTIPVLALYGFFFYLQKYTADQTVVQRYLVARTDRDALRGVALGAGLCIPVWASFMLIGSLLWAFYRLTGEALPRSITKTDQVFPHFLVTHLAPGAAGLFIAAFFGAAIAMLASDMNCLSLICVEDFYRRFRPKATDGQRLRVGKIIVVAAGAGAVLVALVLAQTAGSALSLYYTVTAIVAGGLAGLFMLAFLVPRASARGAQLGIILSLLVTTWATLTANGGKLLNLSRWNFPWHEYLIGVVGHLVLFVSGVLFSLAFPARQTVDPRLTLRGWLAVRNHQRSISTLLVERKSNA